MGKVETRRAKRNEYHKRKYANFKRTGKWRTVTINVKKIKEMEKKEE